MEKEYFDYKKDYWKNEFFRSSDKANFHSDNFCKMEIEITLLVIGLVSFGIYFDKNIFLNIKLGIFFICFFAFLSLVFGLINFHIKNKFWSDTTDKVQKINKEYLEFLKTENNNAKPEEYKCLFEKEKLILEEKKSSSRWPWVWQSIFLSISILTLIIVSIIQISFPLFINA
jgi:cellulose synthase/poly-beta-1,6-N-acetylglucosamine synthase-like glycosyltransferase